jgi:hypothetical protein
MEVAESFVHGLAEALPQALELADDAIFLYETGNHLYEQSRRAKDWIDLYRHDQIHKMPKRSFPAKVPGHPTAGYYPGGGGAWVPMIPKATYASAGVGERIATGGRDYFRTRDVVGRGEHHFTDSTIAQAYNTTGVVTLLNDVAEGTSTQERAGRKVMMTGMTIRAYAYNGTTAVYNKCVTLIVEDLRPTGSLPAVSDIVESIQSNAMNNEAGFGRFKIHMRKSWILRGQGTGGASVDDAAPWIRNFDKFKPLKNREVHYSGATGGIGEIIKGALYLVTFGNLPAGTGAATLEGNIRLAFKDIH